MQQNNAAQFLQYIQSHMNHTSLINNPALAQLKTKYANANPQQLAYQMAQERGISPQQLDQIMKQLNGITQ